MRRWLFLVLPAALASACAGDSRDDRDRFTVRPGQVDVSEPGKADDPSEGDSMSTRVELKVMVAYGSIDRAMEAFGLEKSNAQARNIYFYDTADLDLYERGLVLRARHIEGDPDDSTVKLRPATVAEIGEQWESLDGFKCELDRSDRGAVHSCSLTSRESAAEIEDVAMGDRSVKTLYSKEQEALAALRHSEIGWDDLLVLGPTDAWVWDVESPAYPGGFTVERWELPDGETLLEVSRKSDFAGEEETEAALHALIDSLAAFGIEPDPNPQSKTLSALLFFTE